MSRARGEHGIGGERLEERRVRVEAARAAPERRPQIEAKAVETAVDHPAPERADRHLDDQRAVKRKAISGACVVDVKRWIARVEAEPGLVVETAERQRRPKLVAFAVMVEDDVENGLHARRVQGVGRGANLLPAAGSKAGIGRAEHDRVITPCVRETRAPAYAARRRTASAGMISTAVTPSAVRCAIEAGCASPAKVPRAASGMAGLSREKPRRLSS